MSFATGTELLNPRTFITRTENPRASRLTATIRSQKKNHTAWYPTFWLVLEEKILAKRWDSKRSEVLAKNNSSIPNIISLCNLLNMVELWDATNKQTKFTGVLKLCFSDGKHDKKIYIYRPVRKLNSNQSWKESNASYLQKAMEIEIDHKQPCLNKYTPATAADSREKTEQRNKPKTLRPLIRRVDIQK